MCFIIALAIYDGGIDLAVPALLIGLFLGNASFFASGHADPNERANIRIRQAEGIAQARARGVQFGRPIIPTPSNWAETIESFRRGEITQTQAADRLNMPLSTFRYRLNKCKN